MQIGGEWLDARSGKTFETIDPCVSDMYRNDLLYVYTASPVSLYWQGILQPQHVMTILMFNLATFHP